MRELAERAYYQLALSVGRLLRAGRYSRVRIGVDDGHVQKDRRFYAPLLVWLGDPLVSILDTGVKVLRQREWEERERMIYHTVHGASIRVAADGVLVLPHLRGKTLATLLEDPALEQSTRQKAIELAVVALAEFHKAGFTHGDAMAENVMIDLGAGAARWFDFETVHDEDRPLAWRRADDLRALLTTCLLRTAPERLARTLHFILDVYADERVARLLATGFPQVLRRPLAFHLGQAGLSIQSYREIARLLRERYNE